ncbi:hypothetical protein LguiB_023757 [Lonicera macranthoides]
MRRKSSESLPKFSLNSLSRSWHALVVNDSMMLMQVACHWCGFRGHGSALVAGTPQGLQAVLCLGTRMVSWNGVLGRMWDLRAVLRSGA